MASVRKLQLYYAAVRPELARRNLLACCGKQRAEQDIVWAGLHAQASQLTLAFQKLELIHVFYQTFFLFTLPLYSLAAKQMVLVCIHRAVMQT